MLKTFTTLKELRDHLDTIPADKWCRNERIRDNSCCVLGHIDTAVLGFTNNNGSGYDPHMSPLLIQQLINPDLVPIGGHNYPNAIELVKINNNADEPKEAVLAYLDKYLIAA